MRLVYVLFVWLFSLTAFAQEVAFTSSNLPIVIINTNGGQIVDDPKIIVDMKIIDNGAGERNNVTDVANVYDGKAAIEIRGSSSQSFPKKQYGFELRAANGEDDNETALFGMPKEGDWILFAPYNDKSLMRDALAYHLGRSIGDYASRTRYCELVLNDEYMGVYVFLEKVKRGKNRVPIDKLEEDETTGDDVSGGYILKIDKTTGGDEGGFYSTYPPPGATNQVTYFQYEYPKGEDIVPEQEQYISNFIKNFEDALASDDFGDPQTGWTKFADMRSFIDYLIINELTKNPDAYRLSTFMYKQKDSEGGKLFMGPIWDYNLGFGNVDYCTQGTTDGLVIDFNSVCPDDGWLIPFWWQRLWRDGTFRNELADRWTDLRSGVLSNESILGYVDSVRSVLDVEAQQRNFQKWPVLGVYVWPNYQYSLTTFDAEVDWLKDWIVGRLSYLDTKFDLSVDGVDEPSGHKFTVSASPNPFDSEIIFTYEIAQAGATTIEILDIFGRSLSTVASIQSEPGKYSVKATLVTTPGLYVYRVTHNESETITGKLLKK